MKGGYNSVPLLKKGKDFLLSHPLLSEKKYHAVKIKTVIGLFLLCSLIIVTVYYWRSLRWYCQLLLSILILALSPDIDTFRRLGMPYDKYKKNWEEHNDRKIG